MTATVPSNVTNLFEGQAEVAEALQRALVDLIALPLIGKQAHWAIRGPKFHSIHTFLDELIEAWRLAGDDVAERMTALDVAPRGHISVVESDMTLEPLPKGFIKDDKVIQLVDANMASTIEVLRDVRSDVADADPVTEDLIIGIIATLEKQLWMLRSHLQ